MYFSATPVAAGVTTPPLAAASSSSGPQSGQLSASAVPHSPEELWLDHLRRECDELLGVSIPPSLFRALVACRLSPGQHLIVYDNPSHYLRNFDWQQQQQQQQEDSRADELSSPAGTAGGPLAAFSLASTTAPATTPDAAVTAETNKRLIARVAEFLFSAPNTASFFDCNETTTEQDLLNAMLLPVDLDTYALQETSANTNSDGASDSYSQEHAPSSDQKRASMSARQRHTLASTAPSTPPLTLPAATPAATFAGTMSDSAAAPADPSALPALERRSSNFSVSKLERDRELQRRYFQNREESLQSIRSQYKAKDIFSSTNFENSPTLSLKPPAPTNEGATSSTAPNRNPDAPQQGPEHSHASSTAFDVAPIFVLDKFSRVSPQVQSLFVQTLVHGYFSAHGEIYAIPRDFFIILITDTDPGQVVVQPLRDRLLLTAFLDAPLTVIRPPSNDIVEESVDEMLQAYVRDIYLVQISSNVSVLIRTIVNAIRHHPLVDSGITTRCTSSVTFVAKAFALMDGNMYVSLGNVLAACSAVFPHRFLLKFDNARYSASRSSGLSATLGCDVVRPIHGFSSPGTFAAVSTLGSKLTPLPAHPPEPFTSDNRLFQKKKFIEQYCRKFASLP